MACRLRNDPAQCHNSQERLCISKGINTLEYHQCILTLLESEKNATSEKDRASNFCYEHYGEMLLWTGDKSPEELLYYEMKYGCLKTSGVKHGRDYCRDINRHTENSTTEHLFNCYRKYGVEYSEEYCDYENGGNDDELIKCYEAKDVP